jgi:TatD DNase family protein
MFVDSHCHLDYLADAPGGVNGVVAAARDAGVRELLTIAVDRDNVAAAASIAQGLEGVWASAGVHPLHAVDDLAPQEVDAWLDVDKVVAVGETGLDYHYDSTTPDVQRQCFATQLQTAARRRLPVIVHTREAAADTLRLIRQYGGTRSAGVLHCFTESWEVASAALDLGYCISFSGIVTFRNAGALRDVARRVPPDRLLIETDSPYLAPVPHRGRQNSPALLPAVAACVAELRGVSIDRLAEQTRENFFTLFSGCRDRSGA